MLDSETQDGLDVINWAATGVNDTETSVSMTLPGLTFFKGGITVTTGASSRAVVVTGAGTAGRSALIN